MPSVSVGSLAHTPTGKLGASARSGSFGKCKVLLHSSKRCLQYIIILMIILLIPCHRTFRTRKGDLSVLDTSSNPKSRKISRIPSSGVQKIPPSKDHNVIKDLSVFCYILVISRFPNPRFDATRRQGIVLPLWRRCSRPPKAFAPRPQKFWKVTHTADTSKDPKCQRYAV